MENTCVYSHLTPNWGIREKHLDKTTAKYANLTGLIKEIYNLFAPDFNAEKIYSHFLAFDLDKRLIKYHRKFSETLEGLTDGEHKWETPFVNASWGDWIQVIISRNSSAPNVSPDKPENLKVYANISSEDAPEIFIDSLRYLLDNAESTFAAKISTFSRADQICYWLSSGDFWHLESYYRPLADKMPTSLPFIAYFGKLGISKDLPWPDISHNELQTRIISDYLKTISSPDDIDLEAMYNHYITTWNGDNSSVLSFITIMDTLDGLLTGGLNSNSLLLTDNSELWKTLAHSSSWDDVGRKATLTL